MGRAAWLLVEVVVGVLLAGVIVGAGIGASLQAGYQTAPWMIWVGLLACIAVSVAVGESIRRDRGDSRR
jgi:F0F1-type ATP synthase assembly protein I